MAANTPTGRGQMIICTDTNDTPINLRLIAIPDYIGTRGNGYITMRIEVISSTGSLAQFAINEACTAGVHPQRATGYISPSMEINPGVDVIHFKGGVIGDAIALYW